jgi:hypothetical protein
MRRSISILLAATMAVGGAAASVVPVQAAMPQAAPPASTPAPVIQVQDDSEWWYNQRGGRGWDRGGDRDGQHGWRGGGWDDDDWRWRQRHHRRHFRDRHDDDGAALALGLFGFATGAFLGSQLHGGYGGHGGAYYGGASCGAYDRHDAACDQRFRSYDWCSNTYLGYDGDRHYC